MLQILKRYIFSFIVIIIIFYLSLFKPPKTSLDTIHNLDKVVHFCMYGGLAGVIWLEYLLSHQNKFSLRKIFPIGIIFPILLGGMMELLQNYCTSHRSGDWADFAANSLGVILAGIIGYFVLRPLLNNYHNRKR